ITQKMKRLPFIPANSAPNTEINGGEVRAITTSNRGRKARRAAQLTKKLPKSIARRHFDFFPRPEQYMRRMSAPCHVSLRGNRRSGLSYARLLASTVTS